MNRHEKKQIYEAHREQNPNLEPLEIASALVKEHDLEQSPSDFLWEAVGYNPIDDFTM